MDILYKVDLRPQGQEKHFMKFYFYIQRLNEKNHESMRKAFILHEIN